MASGAQWIPPLPAGYEARWDPNQKAYFFINHMTKNTTWVDPRFPAQPQQAAPQPQHQPQHHDAARSLGQHTSSGGHGGQNVAMTTKYKQFGSTVTSTEGSDDEDNEWENPTDFEILFSNSSTAEKKVDIACLHRIKQLHPSAPEHTIKDLLQQHNNVQIKVCNKLADMGYKREAASHRHPPPREVDMIERLNVMFPEAKNEPGLLDDVLQSTGNDEKAARAMLEAVGFKPVFTSTTQRRSPSPAPKPTSPAHRATSPKRVTITPTKKTTPPKPQVSDAQKKALERKVQAQFKTTDMTVIQMALQVCGYDESRVKGILERMSETQSSSRPSTSRTRDRSPSPVFKPSSSMEPASISMDDVIPTFGSSSSDSRPSTSSSSRPSSSSRSRPGTSTGTKSTARLSTIPKKTSRPSTGQHKSSTTTAHMSQQQRAKQVTQMSKEVLSSTIATLNHIKNNVSCCGKAPELNSTSNTDLANQQTAVTQSNQSAEGVGSHDETFTNENSSSPSHGASRRPVVSQPTGSSYISEYRTQAAGPDPSLHQGPNKQLLLTDYSLAKGPNPELRHGADHSLVAGAMGAVGPDRSLHCGPQHDIRSGPSSGNLITAI